MNYSRAILVLTNGVASPNQVTISTKNRLDKAAEVFLPGDLVITSTSYTVNKKPFLDDNGHPILKAVIAARYIVNSFAIPPLDVVAESFSRDTIGNLFLAFQMIILPMNIQSVVIVTSEFHILRVKAIMDMLSDLFQNYSRNIEYISAKNPDFTKDLWNLIIKKEKESIQYLQNLKTKFKNGIDFTKWFYDEHSAYGYYVNPKPASSIIQKAY